MNRCKFFSFVKIKEFRDWFIIVFLSVWLALSRKIQCILITESNFSNSSLRLRSAQLSISFLDSYVFTCNLVILVISSWSGAYFLANLHFMLISVISWFSPELVKFLPSDFGVQPKFWNLILPFRLFYMVGTKLNQPLVNIHSRKFSWCETQQTAVS